MGPDFNKHTIEVLAKRARFICSNPDCRKGTIGPNSEPCKFTMIGEAAHIHGARPDSKRYLPEMTDAARGEITNGIWLCRNCHKLIDSDDKLYSSTVLYRWRELHEEWVLSELGNRTDNIRNDELKLILEQFHAYPPIIKRIVIDKPCCWEWRLTSELMRYLNGPFYRKLKDLHNNLYVRFNGNLNRTEAWEWVGQRISEIANLTQPIVNLIMQLNAAWGKPGEEGSVDEIHHICLLIKDYLMSVVEYEETLKFTDLPEDYNKLKFLLQNAYGSQVMKLETIPDRLDTFMATLDNNSKSSISNSQKVINETLTFEFPLGWEEEVTNELEKLSYNR